VQLLVLSHVHLTSEFDSEWEERLHTAEAEYKAAQAEYNQYRQAYDSLTKEINALTVSSRTYLHYRDMIPSWLGTGTHCI
jgi:phage-related minor tail protein